MRAMAADLRRVSGCGPLSWVLLITAGLAAVICGIHGWNDAVRGAEQQDVLLAVNALVQWAGSLAAMTLVIVILSINLTRNWGGA